MSRRVRATPHRWILLLLLGSLLSSLGAGCRQEVAPPGDTELRLKALGMLCGQFMARNRGAMPADESQLRAFAQEQAEAFLRQVGLEQMEDVFRDADGQPFVLLYGVAQRPQDVVAHAPPDAQQRRFVVDSLGVVSRWDADEFAAKLGTSGP